MALRNQPKSADESVWNKLGLDRKRITMKEEIDRLAVEWKETSGSRTENSALDDETPVEVHDSVVLPPDNAGARESLQISRLSSPGTSGQQSSVREDENTVAKLLSPHLSSLVDLDCVSLGPNSSDISMDGVSNEIEPPYSRAMSVEIGVPPCEPHVQRALSKAQFSKYASREAEADLKTDSEAGDTGTDPLCSTSSLQVEPPQSQVQEVHETPVYVLDSDEEENGPESVTRAITTSKAKSAIMSSGTEDTAASLPPSHRPRSTLTVEIPASRRAGRGIVSEDEDKVGVRELEIQQIGATRKHKPLRFSPPAST
ncbi:uncharacterized protein EI90DRAFT_2076603 [Cantharellus anzutake]|uniref:uncharacterized protein n=1 Tax=Cantharellus anzutake TaxID=1750568 RepID=UPI0019066E9D|nr:uncharacterized protein EI90DRAFT_2076603 [Cantharellus anzutake]KAF8340541.1 hypothetical protein EI90DRAFT_2076603 [Cantharellus anzutake]